MSFYFDFFWYARTHRGVALTVRELKKFLSSEQGIHLSDNECKQLINEYEPSPACRKSQLMSATGFSHFMVFSEMHDVFDHSKIEHVYQVFCQLIH